MRWSDDVQACSASAGAAESPFTPRDADMLEAFAGLASLALRNAETFTRSSRQARVQRGFYRVASVLGQSLSRAATLDAIAQAAAEALGGAAAAVLMTSGRRLALAGSYQLAGEFEAVLREGLERGDGPLVRAAAQGRVLAAPALGDDERLPEAWRARAAAAAIARCSPCPSRRRARRPAASSPSSSTRSASSPTTISSLRGISPTRRAARSSAASCSRRSEARARSRSSLTRTGRLLTSELDPAAVLDEVVQQAPDLVNADACAIRVLEDDELVVGAAVGVGAEDAVGIARPPRRRWLSGDVVQSRAPVALEDAGSDPRLPRARPDARRRPCGVPRRAARRAGGRAARRARGLRARAAPWRPEEVEAMLALAASTSAALSNAELYQRVALEKERSFAILANIADGIVAVDREGRVVLWNEAAEQITGVPAAEALGRAPDDVLQGTLGSGSDTPAGDRLVSITRSREEVWLSVTEAVMRDPAGSVNGRIFAFRDISSDRLVEQMKSDFVSTVSHELRTPLTSIYGFAETLLRQDVLFGDAERQTFLGYIASESQRLTGIVDALLNVARLDTGDLQVRLAPTDVLGVLDELVQNVEESGANGHHFVLDATEESLAANADRDKLRQVCSILLDNALKYSPAGGTVTVGIERKQHTVEVSVADEGIGIPQSDQDQIFRKFYRGTDAESRAGASGTGLGLFIARGLVTAMGGQDLGRIARRRGIDVRVRAAGRTGVTSGSLGI